MFHISLLTCMCNVLTFCKSNVESLVCGIPPQSSRRDSAKKLYMNVM